MNKYVLIVTAVSLGACSGNKTQDEKAFHYPETKKVDTVTDYFGTKIADPCRWLENDTSKEAEEWVKEENKVTFDSLGKIPFRERIKKRLGEIWNFEKQTEI